MKSPARILVLISSAFNQAGGIHTFNRALIKALDEVSAERNWQVSILSILDAENPPAASQYAASGSTRFQGFQGNRRRFAIAALRAGRNMDKVIFGHVNVASLALGIKTASASLIVHGIEVWRKLPFLQRLGISRMQEILSVSRYTQNAFVRFNGMPPARFQVLPDTLDPFYSKMAATCRSREQLGLPPGRMLLSVGRLSLADRYKKIDLAIQAMPEVLKSAPDAFYVIVGEGEDRARLQNQVKTAGLCDKVKFTGSVPSEILPSYYQACDVFLLPSLKEGFGIVFLEAMYHSKACVAARAGGSPEVIEDGETGLLAEPDDVSSLARCLGRVLADDSLRQAMGRRGRERLERKFRFPVFRQSLAQMLLREN
jgi:glycosyltransferase involved in cell wall biosynthesis